MKTKKIRIGYKEYQLVENTAVLEEIGLLGRCHSSAGLIEYSTKYPKEVVDTILHEVLHAIWHLHLDREEVTEEEVVTMLAHGMTQVMKDNKKFFNELMEKL